VNFMIDMQNKSYRAYLFLMEGNMPCVSLKINNYTKCIVQKQIITWENMKMKKVMLQGFTRFVVSMLGQCMSSMTTLNKIKT
jgi:hypothetical protein